MIIGFDFETFLIDGVDSPKPVCFSWDGTLEWDRTRGVVGGMSDMKKTIGDILQLALDNKAVQLIGHNAKFDLGVLFWHFPDFRSSIFELLARGQIHDTMIREQLLELSTTGHIDGKEYNLAALSLKYLGKDLSHLKSGEDAWRLRYCELVDTPISDYPKEAYDYALGDSIMTREIYSKQEKRKRKSGYASIGNEALQVKSDFCLQLITQRGICIDHSKISDLKEKTIAALLPTQRFLIDRGLAAVKKDGKLGKKKKVFQRHIADTFPDSIKLSGDAFDRFKKKHLLGREDALNLFSLGEMSDEVKNDFYGTVATGADVLEDLPKSEEINAWIEHMTLEKTLTTYIPRLENCSMVYPPYRNLKETGRTSSYVSSSYPSLNVQQMPRQGGLRECFIPRSGYWLATIDYSAIELCCVAQTCRDLFGKSRMAALINSGTSPVDLHAYVGSALYAFDHGCSMDFEYFLTLKKSDPATYKKYRNRGKPIGLGYFGGLGEETMSVVSRGQGVPMTLEQAQIGRRIHSEIFPEIIDYLGWRSKRDGRDHHRVFEKGWVRDQQKEKGYWGYAYEVNGRYRAGCTYCSCANGRAMQSIAADGLKEAIFLCVRATLDPKFMGGELNDCGVIFEIHDEIGFEIPDNESAKDRLRAFEGLMIDGMQKVLPNIRVTVEAGLQRCWTKDDSKHEFTEKYWKDPLLF